MAIRPEIATRTTRGVFGRNRLRVVVVDRADVVPG
jgi:hypothetical protein